MKINTIYENNIILFTIFLLLQWMRKQTLTEVNIVKSTIYLYPDKRQHHW